MAMSNHADRLNTVTYRDGLGERFISAESVTGGVVQVLRLAPALVGPRMFELALRERIVRLSAFRHAAFLTAYRVDRLEHPSPGLAVVSAHVQGIRLSQLLRTAHERNVPVDITTALEVIRQLLPPIALLHEFAPDVATGLIGPERLIVSSAGRITIAEQALGGAIDQLRFDRERLWREFRITVQADRAPLRFSHGDDVMSLGLVALALVLGRPLSEQDFPDGLRGLLDSARERRAIGGDRPLSAPLREWLERALQLDPVHAFSSIAEAWVVFSKTVAAETAYQTTPLALDTLLCNCTVALLQPGTDTADVPASVPRVQSPPSPRPLAPDVVQDPEIHVAMLPPASAEGDLTPLSVAADDIDWTKASEQLTAVASSRDISELLADIDDVGATRSGPPASSARVSVFDDLDDVPDTVIGNIDRSEADSFDDVMPGTRLSSLTARLAALTPSSKLARTAMATALVTVLAVSVVWASLRAPSTRPSDHGILAVHTSPSGLQVLVDGVEQGQTPARVRVSPGEHVLEVRGAAGARVVPVTVSGGAEVSQYIEFSNGTPEQEESQSPESAATAGTPFADARVATTPPSATVPIATTAAPVDEVPTWGWVAVKGPVPLELRSGGKVIGAAGAERVRMAAGQHAIELVNEAQAYRVSRVVLVVPGKVTSVTVEKPQTGTVSLNASPWAEVWIGGRRVGETPLANITIAAGRHEVVFRHPELGEKRQEISVTPGAPVRLAIDMR